MIRRQLAILNVEWGNRYQSLCDLSDKQVMAITGLDAESAARAKDRHYCETLVWLGTPPIAPPLQIRSRRWTCAVCKARGSFMCWVRWQGRCGQLATSKNSGRAS